MQSLALTRLVNSVECTEEGVNLAVGGIHAYVF